MRANLLNLLFILLVLLLVSPFLAAFCAGGEHRKLVLPASAQDRAYADAVAAQADATVAAARATKDYLDTVLAIVGEVIDGTKSKGQLKQAITDLSATGGKGKAAETAVATAEAAKGSKDGKKPK